MGQASGALLGRERVWEDDGAERLPAALPGPFLPSPGCWRMQAKESLTAATVPHGPVHSMSA